jgi:HlyD family secretion protein
MKKKKGVNHVLLIAFILLVAIIVTIIIGLSLPKDVATIEGQAETTDYRLSSKVPSRVLELRVKEGDYVHKGDTLVVMEAPELKAKMEQAHAAYSAAQAMNEEAQNGTRQEQVQGAYEQWNKAIAGREIAEKTYKRISRLFDEGVVPEQKRDEVLAQLQAMQATEKAAKSQYDMAVNGARKEDKAAAGAQVGRAKGAIDEVKSYVDETILTATADGEITEIFPEVGELVGTGAPIMNVSVITDVWFTFDVREDLLPGITIGKKMKVYVPAIGKQVPVRITLMKNVGNFASWKATKALGGFDLKTFEVQAHPLVKVDGVRSGMSAILEPKG